MFTLSNEESQYVREQREVYSTNKYNKNHTARSVSVCKVKAIDQIQCAGYFCNFRPFTQSTLTPMFYKIKKWTPNMNLYSKSIKSNNNFSSGISYFNLTIICCAQSRFYYLLDMCQIYLFRARKFRILIDMDIFVFQYVLLIS